MRKRRWETKGGAEDELNVRGEEALVGGNWRMLKVLGRLSCDRQRDVVQLSEVGRDDQPRWEVHCGGAVQCGEDSAGQSEGVYLLRVGGQLTLRLPVIHPAIFQVHRGAADQHRLRPDQGGRVVHDGGGAGVGDRARAAPAGS